MSTIGDNLRFRREKLELTQDEVAKYVGKGLRAYQYYEEGRSNPKHETLLKLAQILNSSVADLLDEQFVQNEKSVPKERNFLEQRRNKKLATGPYMVPFFPIKAQAGYVKAIDQEVYLDTLEKFALPPGVQPGGASFAYWEIQGDSMEDTFFENDIILTSEVHQMDWDNLRNFYVYVIVTYDGILIKRVHTQSPTRWVLISDNEEKYDQQHVEVESIKQLWIYRKTWATRAKPPKMFEIKI